MRLTLLDLPHAEDVEWPISASQVPFSYVSGDRETLWAKDEEGNTWQKSPGAKRWRRCVTFRTFSTTDDLGSLPITEVSG